MHTDTLVPTAISEKLYDMAQLEAIAAGSKEFLVTLAKIFLQTIPANSSEMVLCAKSGNWDMTSKLAHKLKSTIDSMNMYSIKTIIRTIELDAKNKKNETVPVKVIALKQNLPINNFAKYNYLQM